VQIARTPFDDGELTLPFTRIIAADHFSLISPFDIQVSAKSVTRVRNDTTALKYMRAFLVPLSLSLSRFYNFILLIKE